MAVKNQRFHNADMYISRLACLWSLVKQFFSACRWCWYDLTSIHIIFFTIVFLWCDSYVNRDLAW